MNAKFPELLIQHPDPAIVEECYHNALVNKIRRISKRKGVDDLRNEQLESLYEILQEVENASTRNSN